MIIAKNMALVELAVHNSLEEYEIPVAYTNNKLFSKLRFSNDFNLAYIIFREERLHNKRFLFQLTPAVDEIMNEELRTNNYLEDIVSIPVKIVEENNINKYDAILRSDVFPIPQF
ncbi:hypothetical protein COS83_00430 [archaeon CG07_land_8_20_14_0_80_38_8]|nr:MAG: hypothetical protein COS83_00430 [archaeon CG07_land_8_20_14_0_80_38_8]PIU89261.1 MAG: hypothetical protein COS64_01600 [archaeon CG06_land_8_20_14_3_00_37_11]